MRACTCSLVCRDSVQHPMSWCRSVRSPTCVHPCWMSSIRQSTMCGCGCGPGLEQEGLLCLGGTWVRVCRGPGGGGVRLAVSGVDAMGLSCLHCVSEGLAVLCVTVSVEESASTHVGGCFEHVNFTPLRLTARLETGLSSCSAVLCVSAISTHKECSPQVFMNVSSGLVSELPVASLCSRHASWHARHCCYADKLATRVGSWLTVWLIVRLSCHYLPRLRVLERENLLVWVLVLVGLLGLCDSHHVAC